MTRYQTAQTYASCLKGQAPKPTLPSYYDNELFVQRQTNNYSSLVRPACRLVLANRQTTQPPVADCQLVFIENTWDRSTAIKVTQSTQTDGEADSQKKETPTPSTMDCEKQLFPPNDYPTRVPSRLNPELSPNFALYPVTVYTSWYWEKIWTKPVLVLDLYVKSIKADQLGAQSPFHTYFHPETEFMGIKYRVTIEASRCHHPLTIRRGDTVDINGTNRFQSRYIVESCQLIRNGYAYLAVHFRAFHQQKFTDTRDPKHPSFILAVPETFCKTPLMPHLQPIRPRPTHTRNAFNHIQSLTPLLTILHRHFAKSDAWQKWRHLNPNNRASTIPLLIAFILFRLWIITLFDLHPPLHSFHFTSIFNCYSSVAIKMI